MTKFYFSNALAKKRKKSKLVHVTKTTIGQDSTINPESTDEDLDETNLNNTTEGNVEDPVESSNTEGATVDGQDETTESAAEVENSETDSTEEDSKEVEVVDKKTTTRTRKSSKKSDKTEEISPSDDEKAGDE